MYGFILKDHNGEVFETADGISSITDIRTFDRTAASGTYPVPPSRHIFVMSNNFGNRPIIATLINAGTTVSWFLDTQGQYLAVGNAVNNTIVCYR